MAYSKYSAKPTVVDGRKFASKAEARRGSELQALERARVIEKLEYQPRYPIDVNGQRICVYVGDFRYVENGKSITEDVKGCKTDIYKLKRRLLLAVYPGIDHREVGVRLKQSGRDVSAEVAEIFRDARRAR